MRARHVIGEGQRRRSRAEAEQLVAGFEASGLRRREFCLKHGVALSTLDFWRKRRRQEQGRQKPDAGAKVSSNGRLVAVELADVPAGGGSGDTGLSGSGSNRHAQRIQRIVWIGA